MKSDLTQAVSSSDDMDDAMLIHPARPAPDAKADFRPEWLAYALEALGTDVLLLALERMESAQQEIHPRSRLPTERGRSSLFFLRKAQFARSLHDTKERKMVSILFTDIVESTRQVEALGDRKWSKLLARHHAIVRRQLAVFGGLEIDVPGDGFLAIFDTSTSAIQCARAIRSALCAAGLTIRAGLHAGECEITAGKVCGIAVHIAARIVKAAQGGQILVSSTARELASGSGLRFSAGVTHELKGLSSSWQLFELSGDRSDRRSQSLKNPNAIYLRRVMN